MPTGYTSYVMDGKVTEFKDWALICSRAFGALIEMRDESMDAPLPKEIKPDPYYVNALKEARAELTRLEAMSYKQQGEFASKQKNAQLKSYRESMDRANVENARLTKMRAEVEAWVPPSPDHVEMKKFMLDQIDISFNSNKYYEKEIAQLESKSLQSFYLSAIYAAKRSIQYDTNQLRGEESRAKDRNTWLQQLRDSL